MELNCYEAGTEANTIESSGAGMAFRIISNWGEETRPLKSSINQVLDAVALVKTR